MQYVPIAVASVTFYTYPLRVALGGAASGQERITRTTVAALLVAFCGVMLVVDLRGGSYDPVGIAHAFAAAVLVSVMMLVSPRVRGEGDSRPFTLYMLASATVCYGGACLMTGRFRLPDGVPGWTGFVGSPLFYTFAIIGLFIAIRRIGPVRAALALNVEPVATALLGYLLLGQTLAPLQIAGITMVVAAVTTLRLSPMSLVRAAGTIGVWPIASILAGATLIVVALAAWAS